MTKESANGIETPEKDEAFERLQKIASQVPGVVYQYRMRPDGFSCFPYASERIREIYRVTPEQVREDANPVFNILHPEDTTGIIDSIMLSAKNLQPWKHQYRVKFPDGVVRWLEGKADVQMEADGSYLWHGFITDITEKKQAEDSRVQLEAQLKQTQKIESIGRLAGGVAHDFNNLLTSVLGFSELAIDSLGEGSPAVPYLTRIIETAKKGASLTQQLLAFARKKIVKPENVPLNTVVSDLAPMIERLVGEDVNLRLNLAEDTGVVSIDVGSFEQVIINLVVNARDAMPVGGHLTIETSNAYLDEAYAKSYAEIAVGSYVMLAVSDTGCGMDSEVQHRLFEPFFTTKPAGQGTGLGLAMCFGIVKQAGGHIAAYSEPGAGSTFKVYLPKRNEAATTKDQILKPAVQLEGVETILLVEDEESILHVAREALSMLGYRVLTECNGARALLLAKDYEGPIHLLVTDVVMPRMGGRELASRLELLRPSTKVLYTSGYTEDAIVKHGVLDQGINFLQKPYTLNRLATLVREILDKPVA